MRLVLLPRAKEDLKAIVAWITRKSGDGDVARKFSTDIRKTCEDLSSHSFRLGAPRPELGEGIRSYVHGNYLILFRYTEDAMEVVMIVEGHRDLDSLQ